MPTPNTQPQKPIKKPQPDLQDDPPPDTNYGADNDDNEGEGNKSADRNYRAGVQAHLKTHDVRAEAKAAEAALDDKQEGAILKKAEAAGRKPARR